MCCRLCSLQSSLLSINVFLWSSHHCQDVRTPSRALVDRRRSRGKANRGDAVAPEQGEPHLSGERRRHLLHYRTSFLTLFAPFIKGTSITCILEKMGTLIKLFPGVRTRCFIAYFYHMILNILFPYCIIVWNLFCTHLILGPYKKEPQHA